MLSLRTIRSQMYLHVGALLVIVMILVATGLHGVSKFRQLTRSIRERSIELPLAADLGQKISELNSVLWKVDRIRETGSVFQPVVSENPLARGKFARKLTEVERALTNYEFQLENGQINDPNIADTTKERAFVEQFRKSLAEINSLVSEGDWSFYNDRFRLINNLQNELEILQHDAAELPAYMQHRMHAFSENARGEYRTWMTLNLVLSLAALVLFSLLVLRLRRGIVKPLVKLLEGSRQVAAGNYDYRIRLDTDDEVAELGEALNAMTSNFQEIKRDLNKQVRQRTKAVVQSEKMASVGFLAAGVAHEINNPLASIAWSAESLESRLAEILDPATEIDAATRESEIDEMKKYLVRIQEEAFRCKEITGGLLDFARMGDMKKSPASLAEIIESVIDIVKPLSRFRDRNIHFHYDEAVVAIVNAQEIKQVVLNLITNALGSVEPGGTVQIDMVSKDGNAILRISDNGCGMTEEVRQHLFEPFFTRRRDGQGTGLGLSITWQIIEDHGGKIHPHSDGPGHGSQFTITLPLVDSHERNYAKSA